MRTWESSSDIKSFFFFISPHLSNHDVLPIQRMNLSSSLLDENFWKDQECTESHPPSLPAPGSEKCYIKTWLIDWGKIHLRVLTGKNKAKIINIEKIILRGKELVCRLCSLEVFFRFQMSLMSPHSSKQQ